jgi:hypothetical protein
VNEKGCRIGETHPAAKFTDGEVMMVFNLKALGWGYRRISRKLEMSKSQVRKILKGQARCQTVREFKQI